MKIFETNTYLILTWYLPFILTCLSWCIGRKFFIFSSFYLILNIITNYYILYLPFIHLPFCDVSFVTAKKKLSAYLFYILTFLLWHIDRKYYLLFFHYFISNYMLCFLFWKALYIVSYEISLSSKNIIFCFKCLKNILLKDTRKSLKIFQWKSALINRKITVYLGRDLKKRYKETVKWN